MPLLSIIKQILIKYPVLERMIDDEENEGSGVYSPTQTDPDLAKASSSKLIELAFLMVSLFLSSLIASIMNIKM